MHHTLVTALPPARSRGAVYTTPSPPCPAF